MIFSWLMQNSLGEKDESESQQTDFQGLWSDEYWENCLLSVPISYSVDTETDHFEGLIQFG